MAKAAGRLSAEGKQRGSGSQGRAPEPRYLAVGEVIGSHGIRGELKVLPLTDDPFRFRELTQVLIGPEDEKPVARRLDGFRLHKGNALLLIEGCTDRDTAESMRGMLVQIPLEKAIPLQDDEYFEHQILNLAVWTTGGEYLGTVDEVIFTGANEVYVVQGPSPDHREILLPAIKQVILDVDLEAGKLTVELPDGLL